MGLLDEVKKKQEEKTQDLSVSGDEGAYSEPRDTDSIPRGEDEEPRNGGLPSVSYRDCDRRYERGEEPADGEVGFDALL